MPPLVKRIDRDRLHRAARGLEKDVVRFLRDLCRIPATSNQEGPVVERVGEEMRRVGFDEVKVDPFGNILGRIGNGRRVIAMDSHLDTVGVGDRREWPHDPYEGLVKNGKIYARGSSDQRGGIAALVYGAKIMKDLDLLGDFTCWMVGSVCEEDSDGICWLYILREKVIEPEVVVVTEPTNMKIYRGHRGRMEIEVEAFGKSCHGSAPERGDNAIYKTSRIALEVERLNGRLRKDAFLGKGTITVSETSSKGPSQCAVPGYARLYIDRRLTAGESKALAVKQIKDLPATRKARARVTVPTYTEPSWKGTVYPMEKYYPGWVLPETHPAISTAVRTYRAVYGRKPVVDKWVFSTNATAITGLCGVPAVGFGPGNETCAHQVDEHMPIKDLRDATAFYAAFPLFWTGEAG